MRSLALAVALLLCASASAGEPTRARRAELRHLVLHDCGSCHGMTLAGGLGPPLTATALARHSVPGLETTIAYGRPGTPMPPWRGLLTDGDILWLAQGLKRGAFALPAARGPESGGEQ